MHKTMTLSVRLPEEDASFVAGLTLEGAVTPSDKLRSIIRDARLRTQISSSFDEAHTHLTTVLHPVSQAVRNAENQTGLHSEVVERVLPWLAETVAFAVSNPLRDDASREDLSRLESGLATRIFRLFEFSLRMAATEAVPGYDKAVMEHRLADMRELMKLVLQRLEDKHHD